MAHWQTFASWIESPFHRRPFFSPSLCNSILPLIQCSFSSLPSCFCEFLSPPFFYLSFSFVFVFLVFFLPSILLRSHFSFLFFLVFTSLTLLLFLSFSHLHSFSRALFLPSSSPSSPLFLLHPSSFALHLSSLQYYL